jgi:NAD dependent epimerase/dehydratase family enzyme
MATVLITGGTGMIGTELTKVLLEKDYHVIILSRDPSSRSELVTRNLSYAQWNLKEQTIDKDAITKADYIIHLAGAGIADERWTKKRKWEIVNSRVKGGELLVKALKENTNRVKAIVSASAIGWYGPSPPRPSPQSGEGRSLIPGLSPQRGEEKNPRPFEESDPHADDFLGHTCNQWEASLEPVTKLGKRLVRLRTGIVLSNTGGALKKFKEPLQFDIAAILGNGKQIMSWIHIDDLVRLYIAATENENMEGNFNAVAPNPVSNKEFTLQLARIERGKFFISVYVPSFILKLVLGEMSIEVLKSATINSEKIQSAGFTFLYPTIDTALKELKK